MSIDILTVQKGDLIEYGPYLCSDSLKRTHSLGMYEGFMYWSPDERPVELWVNLTAINASGVEPHATGTAVFVRASQIINVTPCKG